MTDASASRQQAIFDDLASKAGGVANLSPLHVELCALAAALLVSAQDEPANLTKTADTISGLLARLPSPAADDGPLMDLHKLTDDELRELERIQCKACDQAAPDWVCPEPEPDEPTISPRERCARDLARWLDEKDFGGDHRPDEREIIHMENEVGSLFYSGLRGLIAHSVLWAEMRRQEIDAAVRAEQDRLMRATKADLDAASKLKPADPEPAPSAPSNVYDLPLPRVRDFGDNPN